MKFKQGRGALGLVAWAGLCFGLALPVQAAYWVDGEGSVVKNSSGECWADSYKEGQEPVIGCDGVTDSDQDAVADGSDQCANTPIGVEVDAAGCPLDADGDGVPNYKDRCPGTPAGVPVDTVGCPLDDDDDDVTNEKDKCPESMMGARVDENGCEVVVKRPKMGGGAMTGDKDSDGDGVPDDKDECPDTPAGSKVNSLGCPIVLRGVNFEFDSATLTASDQQALDRVAETLLEHPDLEVAIVGHTDDKGSNEYNQKLSERRAQAVVDYLVSLGVDGSKLTAVGYGEEMPIADNNTDEGRAENRRVELQTP